MRFVILSGWYVNDAILTINRRDAQWQMSRQIRPALLVFQKALLKNETSLCQKDSIKENARGYLPRPVLLKPPNQVQRIAAFF